MCMRWADAVWDNLEGLWSWVYDLELFWSPFFVFCGQHLPTFLAPFPAKNPPLALIHSLLAMVLGVLHIMEKWIVSHCLKAQLEGGWMGLMLELLVPFFACASSLTVEWSCWATYPTAIASKPPRPNPGPTLIAERSAMHVGGEVRGSTWMKWARFRVSIAFAPPCVNMRRESCDYGGRWMFSSLWPPLFTTQVVLLIPPKSCRHVDLPKVAKTASVLLPWSRFFGGGLSDEGMHVPDWVSRSFYTCKPTDRLIKTLPFKLIGGEGSGVPPPLRFNSLFLN
jgi:hypothetical protein